MVPEVEDSVAVGLCVDGDVEIVLFVTLAPTAEEGGGGRIMEVRGGRKRPSTERERREPPMSQCQSVTSLRADDRSYITTRDRGRAVKHLEQVVKYHVHPLFTRASALQRICLFIFRRYM